MSTNCLRCDRHVASGAAFLVLSGDLTNGEFTARGVSGVAHEECVSPESEPIGHDDFPLIFALA